MKKLIVVIVFGIIFCNWLVNSSQAQELDISDQVSKIPSIKTGIAYSIIEGGINHTQTIELVSLGKYATIDLGYAGDSGADHKAVVGLSFNLIESGFIKYPILEYVAFKPQVLYGFGRINAQELDNADQDILVGAKLLEWKF